MGWLVSSDGCDASAITTRLLAEDTAASSDAVRNHHVEKPLRSDLAVPTSEQQRDKRRDGQVIQDTVVHRLPQQPLHGGVLSVRELCCRRVYD